MRLKDINPPAAWMTMLSARRDGGQNNGFSLAGSIFTATSICFARVTNANACESTDPRTSAFQYYGIP
jgi:hypothetical protein